MKLAQFKSNNSDRQRLGMLIGESVCDVAELARAVKGAGGNLADWLLNVDNTLSVITHGDSALDEINALVSGDPTTFDSLASTVAYPADAIEFLPAVYP